MKNLFSILLGICLFAGVVSVNAETPEPASLTFGKAPSLTESADIAAMTAKPETFVDKTVLVQGKIVDMCRHKGCWVEVQSADSATILCKSLDESINFTPNCLGQMVSLQGKLMYDPKAPGAVQKQHEGEAAHSCPAPKVLVSIDGAVVDMATAK